MLFPRPYSLQEIAGLLNAQFDGDPDFEVTGINEIHMVEPGNLTFVDHPKYYDKALNSKATTILINKEVPEARRKSPDHFRRPFQGLCLAGQVLQAVRSLHRNDQPDCSNRRRHRHPTRGVYRQPCEDREELHYTCQCQHL